MPTPIDIQAAVVNQAADNAEQITEAADAAEQLDVRGLISAGLTADEIVEAILVAGVAASAAQMQDQLGMVVRHVSESADALRKSDPATVPAVKSEVLAKKRAEKANK